MRFVHSLQYLSFFKVFTKGDVDAVLPFEPDHDYDDLNFIFVQNETWFWKKNQSFFIYFLGQEGEYVSNNVIFLLLYLTWTGWKQAWYGVHFLVFKWSCQPLTAMVPLLPAGPRLINFSLIFYAIYKYICKYIFRCAICGYIIFMSLYGMGLTKNCETCD